MPNPEKLKPEKLKPDFNISEFQQVSVSALDYYRRAIYLEPDHYETLVHLALLLERTGDVAGARTFRRRAERSEGRMKNEE